MQIIIDQSEDDPKIFLPKCENAKIVANLLGRKFFTPDDLAEITSVPFEFLIAYEDIPIGGRFRMYEEHVVWYDKRANRYFGRKLDSKGYLNTHHTATGRSPMEVREKLFKLKEE